MKTMLSGLRALRAQAFVCVALLSVVTMGGCSGDDSTQEPEAVVTPTTPVAEEYRLQVKAQIAPMSAESRQIVTRALEDKTGMLKKTWGSVDKVKVYDQYWNASKTDCLSPQTPGKTSATLTGTIQFNSMVKVNDGLHFVFPGDRTEWTYMGQTGTLDGLAANYDYARGMSEITDIADNVVTAKDFTLSNEQAIVKFVLKNASDVELPVKRLTISTANNKLVQTKGEFVKYKDTNTTYGPITVAPSSATNTLWVALCNEQEGSDKYVLTATDESGYDYRFSKSGIELFKKGEAYEVELKMKDFAYAGDWNEPLTLEAVESGTVIVNNLLDDTKLQYSADKVNWHEVPKEDLRLKVDKGTKVYLRGDNSTFASGTTDQDTFVHIGCTDDCYIYGNIMSLAYSTDFSKSSFYHDFEGTFYNMFYEDPDEGTHLQNHPSRKLILPLSARSSFDYCYKSTFGKNLTYTTIP